MTLESVAAPPLVGPLPAVVARFLEAGAASVEASRFRDPRLVPSDHELVYRVLATLRRGTAASDRFCEWGAGTGVVTGLAALLGCEAVGVECNEDLVDRAEDLSRAFDLETTFLAGSFVPEDHECPPDPEAEALVVPEEPVDESIDDFDVIFVYPAPGQEEFLLDLFDRHAAVGATLVAYFGVREGMYVGRKVDAGPARSR